MNGSRIPMRPKRRRPPGGSGSPTSSHSSRRDGVLAGEQRRQSRAPRHALRAWRRTPVTSEDAFRSEPQVLLSGLAYVESPRWHDGRLWFAHWGGGQIVAVDLDGVNELIGDGFPSLGWSMA